MSVVHVTYRQGKSAETKRAIVIVRGDLTAALAEFGQRKPNARPTKAEEVQDEVIIEEQYKITPSEVENA
jgi:hypothetical protein